MQYYASTVPIKREATILKWRGGKYNPTSAKVEAPAFVASLGPRDELWLMMGSTNAAVALGAFRRGTTVHQVSYARALPHILALHNRNGDEEKDARIKISAEDVFHLAESHPGIFYPMYPQQGEVLEIISAWQSVVDSMEARKSYANVVRSRLQQKAVVSGNVASIKELDALIEKTVGKKDPTDPGMQGFFSQEKSAEAVLGSVLKDSGLYASVFEPIESVGPKLAARFITAIERIERFATPEDLMRYAGMLPTKGGKLPSKKRGELLNRDPEMNTACWLLQDQMFQWGANSEFGRILHDQVRRECPCTQEERDGDKELRSKHSGAVKQARIAMTRVFLEQIWRDWREYTGLATP